MLVSAVILGLLSSFHCLGMCGPIAFVLPIDRNIKSKAALQTLLYHLGRLLSYGSIGLLFGLIGKGFYLSGFQQRFSILMGLMMIAIIAIPIRIFNRYNFSRPIYVVVGRLKNKLGLYLKKTSYRALFSIGVFNGLLPCGMVYIALVGAMATTDPYSGVLYMLLFGLGTVPMMTLAAFSKSVISVRLRSRLAKMLPLFVVLIGILFILRGMGLGIPYVSPKEVNLQIAPYLIECVE